MPIWNLYIELTEFSRHSKWANDRKTTNTGGLSSLFQTSGKMAFTFEFFTLLKSLK